jgi:hypothetical protein
LSDRRSDRGYHRARNNRAGAWDRHYSFAAFVLASQRFDLAGEVLNARVQVAPVRHQILEEAQHARRERIGLPRKNARQFGPQETHPLPHRDSALQPESADLIDDARALTYKPLAHPVQRLQVELVGRLGCNELHSWALPASAIASASR